MCSHLYLAHDESYMQEAASQSCLGPLCNAMSRTALSCFLHDRLLTTPYSQTRTLPTSRDGAAPLTYPYQLVAVLARPHWVSVMAS